MDNKLSETSQSPATIKPISLGLPDAEIETLKKEFYSNKWTGKSKESIQRKLGGRCVICGGLAEHIASYDCNGAVRIERYCSPCVKKTFSRTQKLQIGEVD